MLPKTISRTLFTNSIKKTPVKLSFASYDEKSSSEKSPIIVMHGLFGSKNNWNSLSKSLNQQTQRKVIAIDARNHGNSPHSSVHTYKSMAEDVEALLHDFGYEKSVLIGHSMGGGVMMYTALQFPSIVEKLIVVDMSPIKTSPSLHEMTEIIDSMLSTDFGGLKTLSEARKKTDNYLANTIKSPAIRQFLLTNIIEENPGIFKWRINLPIIAENFSSQIANFPSLVKNDTHFDGPTLFIGGSESDYIKEEDHERIGKIFTNSRIEYVKGAGHWVQSDKPAEFLKLSSEFINQ